LLTVLMIAANSQKSSKPSSVQHTDRKDLLVKFTTASMVTASNASSNVSASDIDSIIGIVFGLIAAIIVLTCSFLTLRSLQYIRMQRLLQYGLEMYIV
jgi:ABC-type multidrug transport system permease subunit